MRPGDLAERLRLIVITDRDAARPRSVAEVVHEALAAGARAVQLRMKEAGAGEMLDAALGLRGMTRGADALLFVNDRVDVALAAGADGVHLGPADLPVAPVRARVGSDLLIGYSADDPDEARRAVEAGADYVGCGSVWRTGTKELGDEAIGLERLDEVARSVPVPVVGVGGVTPERAAEVARTRAAGIAVVGAVMGAGDPGNAVRRLIRPFRERGRSV